VSELVTRHLDAAIAAIAARQHGVISLDQLRALGLTASAIRARVRRGSLIRLHRGVYAVGHAAIKVEGHLMAAVLACGEGAVLSHRAAAAHLDLRRSDRARIDVTVPGAGTRAKKGIEIHRSRTLAPADVIRVENIPTTSVARTLLDLAEVVSAQALERAFDRAEFLQVLDMRALAEVMERNLGRRGLARLRALLSNLDPARGRTRTELERLFLTLCANAGLPRPLVNAHLLLEGDYIEADFHWPAYRLVAETDGWATHSTRRAFQRDRHRDQLLLRAGYRVVRFTWRDVIDNPAWVADTVRRGLTVA
jgi:predicted transcriptional regulator of viral defense system